MASMVLRMLFNISCFIDWRQYIQLTDKKSFTFFSSYCTVYINSGYIYSICVSV